MAIFTNVPEVWLQGLIAGPMDKVSMGYVSLHKRLLSGYISFIRAVRSEIYFPPFFLEKKGGAQNSRPFKMLRLNGQAHAQQPVITGCLIHCGVQSFSTNDASLSISMSMIIPSALCQNTAGAVFRPLNQHHKIRLKGEIRRCTFS
jgi:hypothetical protein